MRPIRLELQGFTSFREPTVVDFGDADLFALSGPTGSGKSSLIDAMGFALYGSVPRYNDPSLVQPVISQGLLEARVRFDFAVDGRTYTAVRVVRRTQRGARTKEARLESGDEVLAGSPGELDDQVRELFGLTFYQFTTCVVLPQGQFARFLHAPPKERLELLKDLLQLRLYERLGQLARQRAADARRDEQLQEQLMQDVADATPAARRDLARRVRELEKLKREVDRGQRELDRLSEQHRQQQDRVVTLKAGAARLKKLKPPRGLAGLARRHTKALKRGSDAAHALQKAEAALKTTKERREALPDPAPLRETLRRLEQRDTETRRVQQAEAEAEGARKALENAETERDAAQQAHDAATREVETIRRHHAAHDLARGLTAGDDCPVCHRPLDAAPRHRKPAALAAARRHLDAAVEQLQRSAAERESAMQAHAAAARRVEDLRRRVSELDAELRDAPARDEIEARLESIDGLDRQLKADEQARDRARDDQRGAEEEAAALEHEVRQGWETFEQVRSSVTDLEPPGSDRDDLSASWTTLQQWAQKRGTELGEAMTAAHQAVSEIEARRDDRLQRLSDTCSALDVDVTDSPPGEAVAAAIAQARTRLEQLDHQLERRKAIETQRTAARERRELAHALGQHLRTEGFERWLLHEAFEGLVHQAGIRLHELSSGDYSFALNERLEFEIVDHRNADELRSVKTLSGGETFLASLSLALALAEQVAELASDGAARLDSIFLDEGFGTLDPDTLETVAAVIEELGARGRVVGLVTHVRELAERMPVRFQVRKGPTSSAVERIAS